MKRAYVTPVMECEEFVANEYVAACLAYRVICQTPNNNDWWQFLFDDTNGNGSLDVDEDTCVIDMNDYFAGSGAPSFTGCGKVHEVTFTEKPHVNGFAVKGIARTDKNGVTTGWNVDVNNFAKVFWWRGDPQTGVVDPNGTNVGEHMIDLAAVETYKPTNATS